MAAHQSKMMDSQSEKIDVAFGFVINGREAQTRHPTVLNISETHSICQSFTLVSS